MLQVKLDKWTFRFIALKTDLIHMQNTPVYWASNLTIAIIEAPQAILPGELYHRVKDRLQLNGFEGWGILDQGSRPSNVSGLRVVQPQNKEEISEDVILTISVDYRLPYHA